MVYLHKRKIFRIRKNRITQISQNFTDKRIQLEIIRMSEVILTNKTSIACFFLIWLLDFKFSMYMTTELRYLVREEGISKGK